MPIYNKCAINVLQEMVLPYFVTAFNEIWAEKLALLKINQFTSIIDISAVIY
jgi:hypothetical protein